MSWQCHGVMALSQYDSASVSHDVEARGQAQHGSSGSGARHQRSGARAGGSCDRGDDGLGRGGGDG